MSERRLAVNTEPLETVSVRMGEGGADVTYVVCARLTKAGKTVAASVHQDWCPRAPQAGQQRADGSVWTVVTANRAGVGDVVAAVEERGGIIASVSCSRCDGWTVR